MCVGLVHIAPAEFWKMTFAESLHICRGFYLRCEYRSLDFRNIYGLIYNVNSKTKRNASDLWPLSIDKRSKNIDESAIIERNEKLRKSWEK